MLALFLCPPLKALIKLFFFSVSSTRRIALSIANSLSSFVASDQLFERVEVLVKVYAVDIDITARRGKISAEAVQDRGFSRS